MRTVRAVAVVGLIAGIVDAQERDDDARPRGAESADEPDVDSQGAHPAPAEPDKTPSAPLWQPGNSTTSSVVPGVVGDDEPPAPGDGAYGRFEGDVDVGIYAGTELDEHGAGALVGLSAHYYWMAGVTIAYVDALGRNDATFQRLFAVGVDLRPAFVPRWSEDYQDGPGFTDLMIDSISLGLGVFWTSPPRGSFGDRRGFEASAGFGVPLFASAEGLWLHARGALRWQDPSSDDERAIPAALLSLAWHEALQVR